MPEPTDRTTHTGPLGSRPAPWSMAVAAAALTVGLVARAYVVVQPPASSMLWDHHEYVRWGVLMHEEGLSALYDHPPRESLMWNHEAGGRGHGRHPEHFISRTCNYPPLAGLLLYAEMSALRLFDPTLTSNTVEARAIYGLLSILGDVLTAIGCFVIVRRLASPMAAAVALSIIMLAPPFVIDSARWTQTDSWVLAPGVWMLWAMMNRRWLSAGMLWGLALGLKTQGILFAPLWLFALLLTVGARWSSSSPRGAARERTGTSPDGTSDIAGSGALGAGPPAPGKRRRIIAGPALAVLVLLASSVPFARHSGLEWFEEAYVGNFTIYKDTTLKAFNIWYIDLLLCDDLDAGVRCLGLEKDTWGKLMLAAVLLGAGALLWRRRGRDPHTLLLFAAILLLAVVIFPTRVHERYIVLPIPFLVIAAARRRALWLPLIPFLIAATAQMLALDWLGRSRGAGSWPDVWAWHRSEYLEKYEREYEELRGTLPPEQFADVRPPEEELRHRCREGYLKYREEVAPSEWALTALELASAGGLFGVLLFSRRGTPLRYGDGGDAP